MSVGRFASCLALSALAALLAACGGMAPKIQPPAVERDLKQEEQKKEQPVKPDEKKPPKKEPTKRPATDFSKKRVQLGDVEVQLISATIGPVPLKEFGRVGESEKDHFRLAFKITNHHRTRRLKYEGWSKDFDFDGVRATLQDEHGNAYRHVSFGLGTKVVGQVEDPVINPGESITDVLVFEKPLAIAKELTITLPLKAIQDQTGTIRGIVPRSFGKGP
jgi:hypothetical protein